MGNSTNDMKNVDRERTEGKQRKSVQKEFSSQIKEKKNYKKNPLTLLKVI